MFKIFKLHESDKLPITKFSLFCGLLISVGLECGFSSSFNGLYRLNSNFGFDKFILNNFADVPSTYNCQNVAQKFEFKFVNDCDQQIVVVLMECGDIILITAYRNGSNRSNLNGYNLAIPLSRYVPLVYREKVEKSFRNLKELSIKLKNLIFLPLRNEIYDKIGCANPSLRGLPQEVLTLIIKGIVTVDDLWAN